MGRTHANNAGRSLRLRTVAAFLFALLFGFQLAPLAQAQPARTLDCCMAAEGKGCSMHLHRAAQAQGHTLAALQPLCPCMPMALASAGAHDAVSLSKVRVHFVLHAERAASIQLCSPRRGRAAGRPGTRGPPALTFA